MRGPCHVISPAERTLRTAASAGEIKWQGTLIYVCSTLIGEAVAVEETETGDWQVRFFDAPIGVIDRLKQQLRRSAAPVPGAGRTAPPPRHAQTAATPARARSSPL